MFWNVLVVDEHFNKLAPIYFYKKKIFNEECACECVRLLALLLLHLIAVSKLMN